MSTHSRSLAVSLVALFLFAASCGSGGAETGEATGSRASRESRLEAVGEARVSLNGVRIEFESSVRFHHKVGPISISASKDSVTTRNTTVNGQPFGVRDGEFFIGKVRYGSVAKGDGVRVAAEGVFVNGERRGSLP